MVTLDKVKDRLAQLGFEVVEKDYKAIEFELNLILDYIVNYCNLTDVNKIPELLDKRIIDRVCAEYLLKQKSAGNLTGFNYEPVIKTIKEGDTQIQFGTENDGDTPENRFDKLCTEMQRGFDKWISPHRKIRW